eukprot:6456966-Amphidinium_carterae.2
MLSVVDVAFTSYQVDHRVTPLMSISTETHGCCCRSRTFGYEGLSKRNDHAILQIHNNAFSPSLTSIDLLFGQTLILPIKSHQLSFRESGGKVCSKAPPALQAIGSRQCTAEILSGVNLCNLNANGHCGNGIFFTAKNSAEKLDVLRI